MLEMSIFTERDDLSAVIEHIKTLDVVDQENPFLLGESQGDCVVGITAPSHWDDVRAIVQYYPAFCIPDDARKRFPSVSEILDTYKAFHRKVGRVYAERLARNMAFLVKGIALAKEKYGLPERESRQVTNFIR